ncbi:hypothetical protein CDL15_Pgr009129 [Punica granatum]|uniref:Uncharacterized protein n=1 Tax=Punica granatum TaxID=22663 RepID=A0A218WMW0_PUNGR|nr:hypothetical protein CDL15_Pgr009129 [Punica granatum]
MKSVVARGKGACLASCGVHELLLGEFAICTGALPCGLRVLERLLSGFCKKHRRLLSGLAGSTGACPADLQEHGAYPVDLRGARVIARRVCKMHGRLPDELHDALHNEKIFSFGSPKQPVKNFALTVQMDPVLGGLDTRPPGTPVSHAWAYRDFPDDALTVLSFVRHTHRFWTLVIRVP